MCLTKSRESGKDCKGVAAQKHKRAYISVKIKSVYQCRDVAMQNQRPSA